MSRLKPGPTSEAKAAADPSTTLGMTNKFVPRNDNRKSNTGILSGEAAQNDGVKKEAYPN
jgi:hypothetical protein